MASCVMTAEPPISLKADLVAESGLDRAVAEEAKRRWQEENREALLSSNAYVQKYGLPLVKYRMF
jgi:antitoxin CcdA